MFRWLNESLEIAAGTALEASAASSRQPRPATSEADVLRAVLHAVPAPERTRYRWDCRAEPSLVHAVFRRVRGTFFLSAAIQTLFEASCIGVAFTAREVMRWMIALSSATRSTGADASISQTAGDADGFAWLVLLSVLSTLCVVFYEQSIWRSRVTAHHIYQLLLEVLFDQVGKLESRAAAALLGPLQQLHSIDATKAWWLGPYMHAWWCAIVLLPVVSYLIHMLIGWPGLLAPALMVGIQLVQLAMSAVSAAYAAEQGRCADRRVHRIAEIVQSMRIVKFMSWEDAVERAVTHLRAVELRHMWHASAWRAAVQSTITSSSTIIVLGVFGAKYRAGITAFEPEDVLSSIILMNSLRATLFKLPLCLLYILGSVAAARRIEALATSESDQQQDYREALLPEDEAAGLAVRARHLRVFSGPEAVMGPVSFDVPAGKVTMVWGPTGSGKSLLLKAIAGEVQAHPWPSYHAAPSEPTAAAEGVGQVEPLSLRCVSPSLIAPVPQDSWIYTGTVRDNILMHVALDVTGAAHNNTPEDEMWYQAVLQACQLEADLAQLPHGDMTVVGERGVTVSGGQRQRIALARAMYSLNSGRSVLLLDDPLSALDAHVGQKVLHECLLGGLGDGTTRVIATSRTELLHHADHCIVLGAAGGICFEGTLPQLLASTLPALDSLQSALCASSPMRSISKTENLVAAASSVFPPCRDSQSAFHSGSPEVNVGNVAASAKWYTRHHGKHWLAALVGTFAVGRGLQVLSELTLVWWTTKAPMLGEAAPTVKQFFTTFVIFCGMSIAVGSLAVVPATAGSSRASARVHAGLMERLIRAPLRLFDITPTASLLINFGQRMAVSDETLPSHIMYSQGFLFLVIGSVVVATYGTRWVLLAYGLGFVAATAIMYRTFPAVRAIKALGDAYHEQPTNTLVEVLGGLSVIRGYQKLDNFTELHRQQARRLVVLRLAGVACHSWQNMRICLLCAVATIISMYAIVGVFVSHDGAMLYRGRISDTAHLYSSSRLDALAGSLVAIAVIPLLPAVLSTAVGLMLDLDRDLAIVDDLRRFTEELPQEDDVPISGPDHSSDESEYYSIRLEDVSVRYAPHLPQALRNVTIEIPAGVKVSVVGRTGSGKSSLGLALLGLVDVCPNDDGTVGTICVGKRDIRSFPSKRALRQCFAFIPQDPVLFAGTVRTNLDPYGLYADEELVAKISAVGLLASRLRDGGLDAVVAERGGNFSQGERQLLCLARSLLKPRCRVLVMDEATASVDAERDVFIQRIVRDSLRGYTVLSIAHRLHTIATSDFVLVLDGGRVAEFAPPRELLACLAGRDLASAAADGVPGLTRLAAMVLSLGPEEAGRIVVRTLAT
jgi:ATP-binding cassette subfamily C (CFTR/MRP) protein 1